MPRKSAGMTTRSGLDEVKRLDGVKAELSVPRHLTSRPSLLQIRLQYRCHPLEHLHW
jgi:hypothetical protein